MYDYIISLGHYCGVAASLSRYGLRDNAGPFDWYVSNLDGVMHFLENDFEDFLLRENLVESKDDALVFTDKVFGFIFNHDVVSNFESEYELIVKKYRRKIDRFLEKEKTGSICFVRSVQDNDEIQYILEKQAYIRNIIKKYNDNNEIIFLIPYYLDISNKEFPFPNYILQINYYWLFREGIRSLFDTNQELIQFLNNNYDKDKLAQNKLYSLETELQYANRPFSRTEIERDAIRQIDYAYKEYRILEKRYNRFVKLVQFDFTRVQLPEKVGIYGMGHIGKALYEKIKKQTQIVCLIDSYTKEMQYDGMSILRPEEVEFNDQLPIIVTPVYDIKKIENALTENGINCRTIPLDELMD